MASTTISFTDLESLKQQLAAEKDKNDYLNESCRKYLLAYEKTKREFDRMNAENDRLKQRINEMREMSLAKEANYEMINHLGSMDQEFFQGTIEKLRQEIVLIKEENKLLKEFSDVTVKDNKKQILGIIRERQEHILVQNTQLLYQNESLRSEIVKKNTEFEELSQKHEEMLKKQLDQARNFVAKDEEIKFWKCTLVELICGEILKSYEKEFEFNEIIDSQIDLSEKFLRIKEKLIKCLKVLSSKRSSILSNDFDDLGEKISFTS